MKTFAFVDASNIIYSARDEGWFIDLRKLLGYLEKKYSVSKAFFYYGKDSKNEEKQKFLNKLKKFGYILRVKELKRFGNKTKANCDVDLTMDVLIEFPKYSRAIVLSGDGDFAPLLAYLKTKGKVVVVISSPGSTAKEIREVVGGDHVDFGGLRYLIEYKKRGRP